MNPVAIDRRRIFQLADSPLQVLTCVFYTTAFTCQDDTGERVHQVSVKGAQVFYQGKYNRKRPPEWTGRRSRREVPMVEVHPRPIVRVLEELGRTLQVLAQRQVDAPLAVLEVGVLEAVRAVQAELLGAVLRLSQRSLWPSGAARQWPCPHCGARHGVQSWRPRTVTTVCGQLTFERPWCVCPAVGRGFSPTDQALALAGQTRLSAEVVEWLGEGGARTSFAEAAALLERWTGLVVSPETVRQRTEASGAGLETAHAAAARQVHQTREAAAPVDPAPGKLVVEADGAMVHYRDAWHEMKIGLVGGHVAGKLVGASYIAQRAGPEQFGPRLLAEAARRGALEVVDWAGSPLQPRLAVLREVVVLGDGAPWIWHLAADHFGQRVEIVDFYHACEHLWAVAKALYGDTAAATAWATARVDELREHGVAPVQAALAAAQAPTPEAQDVLRRERGYFRTNADRMAYPTFRAAGLPIGSGAVESSARHLVQQRLKRSGARWSDAGAQCVMNVRCKLESAQPKAA